MRVIELLNKIAKGKEVPKHIRVGESSYYFDCLDSDYYSDIDEAPSLLERVWRHNTYVWLNLEVEIIEEEKEIEKGLKPYKQYVEELGKDVYGISEINEEYLDRLSKIVIELIEINK